jgi:hypothetical protein
MLTIIGNSTLSTASAPDSSRPRRPCPAPDGGHDDKEHPHAAGDLISRRGNPLSVGVNELVQRR